MADPKLRILIVDDFSTMRRIVRNLLKELGFTNVDEAEDGAIALQKLQAGGFEFVVTDWNMPNMDGLQLLQAIRATPSLSHLPVMMITAKVEEVDRLLGFENGADDYLCKPFSPKEMVARAKALLRRRVSGNTGQNAFVFDPAAQVIRYGEQKLDLTPTELRLFNTLLAQPERVFSREQLLDALGVPADAGYERNIDSHIKSLRAKLRQVAADAEPIQTHRGLGYSYSPRSA